jgi:hypothetical protein
LYIPVQENQQMLKGYGSFGVASRRDPTAAGHTK